MNQEDLSKNNSPSAAILRIRMVIHFKEAKFLKIAKTTPPQEELLTFNI